MILSSTNLVKINTFNSELENIKEYTIVSTRPDINIQSRVAINFFSPYDFEHREKWQGEDFDYDISELGFRDIDLPTHVDLGAFGCSFTFGQALPYSKLWHKVLSNYFNCTSYNFGQPAAGIKTIADIFCIVSQHISFKTAIFLLPPYHRQLIAAEYLHSDNIKLLPIIPNYKSILQSGYKFDADTFFSGMPEVEMIKSFKDNLYLIDYICKLKNIRMYYSSWDADTYRYLQEMKLSHGVLLPAWTSEGIEDFKQDVARDQTHPGVKHHNNFANRIKDYIVL